MAERANQALHAATPIHQGIDAATTVDAIQSRRGGLGAVRVPATPSYGNGRITMRPYVRNGARSFNHGPVMKPWRAGHARLLQRQVA